ncbi:hypothetical protein B0T24DRAFT_327303 [Lasiosphaeria ovina]|uniref:Uncharacterized protein n=1 Tax=Lasiosphaeria ovina TaxID=92902 RepID=A0AAE0N654_9PEZI|nr:hypothetical protein B0T24DRAFT_327303 [Lasiosphaeria ovina]
MSIAGAKPCPRHVSHVLLFLSLILPPIAFHGRDSVRHVSRNLARAPTLSAVVPPACCITFSGNYQFVTYSTSGHVCAVYIVHYNTMVSSPAGPSRELAWPRRGRVVCLVDTEDISL